MICIHQYILILIKNKYDFAKQNHIHFVVKTYK